MYVRELPVRGVCRCVLICELDIHSAPSGWTWLRNLHHNVVSPWLLMIDVAWLTTARSHHAWPHTGLLLAGPAPSVRDTL
jgi:hypothetical protein